MEAAARKSDQLANQEHALYTGIMLFAIVSLLGLLICAIMWYMKGEQCKELQKTVRQLGGENNELNRQADDLATWIAGLPTLKEVQFMIHGFSLWRCPSCGQVNSVYFRNKCLACGTTRPKTMVKAATTIGDTWVCTTCGNKNPKDALACEVCGKKKPAPKLAKVATEKPSVWNCEKCGTNNSGDEKVCRHCGADKPAETPASKVKELECGEYFQIMHRLALILDAIGIGVVDKEKTRELIASIREKFANESSKYADSIRAECDKIERALNPAPAPEAQPPAGPKVEVRD